MMKQKLKMNARQARVLDSLLSGEAGRLGSDTTRDTMIEVGQQDFGDAAIIVFAEHYAAEIHPDGSMTRIKYVKEQKEGADAAGQIS
jgi:hypothetical protein